MGKRRIRPAREVRAVTAERRVGEGRCIGTGTQSYRLGPRIHGVEAGEEGEEGEEDIVGFGGRRGGAGVGADRFVLVMPTTVRLNDDMKSTPDPGPTLAIGDTAARFGLAAHVLRHWEHVGLLRPDRDGAGRRRYGEADAERIAVVLRAKEAGLPLDDIAALLADADPHARRATLRRRQTALAAELARTRTALDLVTCALSRTHDDLTHCPYFREVLTDAGPGAGPGRLSRGIAQMLNPPSTSIAVPVM